MRLTDESAQKEFQSEAVQSVLRTIEKNLGTQFFSVKLKDWGGQGLIIHLESNAYNYKICAKIPHFSMPGLAEAKHAILKEALINNALTQYSADFAPRLLHYAGDGSYLVREYVEGSLLHDAIKEADPTERIKLVYLEWQIISKAFILIHENKWQPHVIRDLKAKNMILSPSRDKITLIDMGSCRCEDNMTSRRKLKMMQRFGSGKFLHWPLEQLLEDKAKCSKKVDYFAFGVLAYETIFNCRPYTNTEKNISQAYKKYKEEYLTAKSKIADAVAIHYLPEELAELMVNALAPNPEDRSFKRWQ